MYRTERTKTGYTNGRVPYHLELKILQVLKLGESLSTSKRCLKKEVKKERVRVN